MKKHKRRKINLFYKTLLIAKLKPKHLHTSVIGTSGNKDLIIYTDCHYNRLDGLNHLKQQMLDDLIRFPHRTILNGDIDDFKWTKFDDLEEAMDFYIRYFLLAQYINKGNHHCWLQMFESEYTIIGRSLVIHAHLFDWEGTNKYESWHRRDVGHDNDFTWYWRGIAGNWTRKRKVNKKFASKAFRYLNLINQFRELNGQEKLIEIIVGHKHYNPIQFVQYKDLLLVNLPQGRTEYTRESGFNADKILHLKSLK